VKLTSLLLLLIKPRSPKKELLSYAKSSTTELNSAESLEKPCLKNKSEMDLASVPRSVDAFSCLSKALMDSTKTSPDSTADKESSPGVTTSVMEVTRTYPSAFLLRLTELPCSLLELLPWELSLLS
jgi:hypothetical protein